MIISVCLTWKLGSTILAGCPLLSDLCLEFIIWSPRDTGGCPLGTLVAEYASVIYTYRIEDTPRQPEERASASDMGRF